MLQAHSCSEHRNLVHKKTVNSPCPVPCCDIQYVFIELSTGTKQASKNLSCNYTRFFQGICQNEWGDTYKLCKITQNMYCPVPWSTRYHFLFILQLFLCQLQSNFLPSFHRKPWLMGIFHDFLAANRAKYEIKSHLQ